MLVSLLKNSSVAEALVGKNRPRATRMVFDAMNSRENILCFDSSQPESKSIKQQTDSRATDNHDCSRNNPTVKAY